MNLNPLTRPEHVKVPQAYRLQAVGLMKRQTVALCGNLAGTIWRDRPQFGILSDWNAFGVAVDCAGGSENKALDRETPSSVKKIQGSADVHIVHNSRLFHRCVNVDYCSHMNDRVHTSNHPVDRSPVSDVRSDKPNPTRLDVLSDVLQIAMREIVED
jgi:hypothetical protein